MANVQIPNLPQAIGLSGSELVEAVQGGTSVRITVNQIASVRASMDGVVLMSGLGSPEGVMSAPVGSLYTRTDGTAGATLYVKESGDGLTGWAAK